MNMAMVVLTWRVQLRAVLLTLATLGRAATTAASGPVAGAATRFGSGALSSSLCWAFGLADFLVCRADV